MREEFKVQLLNDEGLAKASDVGFIFSKALDAIEQLISPGRERALVVTKLQEACFFAKRAIALDPANSAAYSLAAVNQPRTCKCDCAARCFQCDENNCQSCENRQL